MAYVDFSDFKNNPLIAAISNPFNIFGCAGLSEKMGNQMQQWIFTHPGKEPQDVNVPYYADVANLIHTFIVATIVLFASSALLYKSIKFSRTEFTFNPAYLGAEYFGIVTFFAYQVGKNAIEDLKRDRKALNDKDSNLFIGISDGKHANLVIDLKNDSSYAAFDQKYHAKIANTIFKISALSSVLVVCGLGIAGIMDIKRVSQVTLGVGCIGYYLGSYLLRARSDYLFFKAIKEHVL